MANSVVPVRNGIRRLTAPRPLGNGQVPFPRQAKRVVPPQMPDGEIQLMPPPEIERSVPTSIVMRIMPLVMMVGTVGMMAMFMMQGGGLQAIAKNPMMMMMPLMMISSMVMMFANNRNGGKNQQELDEERKDYLRYLTDTREKVRDIAKAQLEHLTWNHPDPHSLLSLVGGRRMWERRLEQPDFIQTRVGIGAQRLATKLLPPEIGHVDDLEPVSAHALSQFIQTQSIVYKLPTSIALQSFSAIQFETRWNHNWPIIRAMLMQLSLFHSPDELLISLIGRNPENAEWSWVKWLPHAQHPDFDDAAGSSRLFFPSIDAWEKAFYDDLNARSAFNRNAPFKEGRIHHIVVLCDDSLTHRGGMLLTENGLEGVTVIDSSNNPETMLTNWRNGLSLRVDEDWLSAKNKTSYERFCQYDSVDAATARTYARFLSRWRVGTAAQIMHSTGHEPIKIDNTLTSLLGINDATKLTPENAWKFRTGSERLRVPIGVDKEGRPVDIDIKEGAEMGYGPHGVCIGATGSGKSEFLRTLVLSLITTHSPEQLNCILVDFKGGATFLGFEKLNHVAAVITNLEEEADLVQRMADALNGEMNRRQNLLRDAGNYANVGDYNKARMKGKPLPAFPALFIIVDEFTELLTQFPEFSNLFDAIGRIGRSIHMHMLLASQRLTGAGSDKIITNLSYRIALKTFTSADSRSIIGTGDAFSLPNQPGAGYLRFNSAEHGESLVRFDASYVSGPYKPPVNTTLPQKTDEHGAEDIHNHLLSFFTAVKQPLPDTPKKPAPVQKIEPAVDKSDEDNKSLLYTIIDALAGAGLPAHEVWLPPLYNPPSVDFLHNKMGLELGELPQLAIPIGIIDLPYYQRQDLMTVDFSSNIGFVGAPQSGKSNALRTMIMSAALANTPEMVQFYCLDFGGGSLNGLSSLPHVGAVVGRLDVDAVRRTFAEITQLINRRENIFKEYRLESMMDYRQRKQAARFNGENNALTQDPFGDVYLVIDGYATFRQEFDALIEQVDAIANQGLSYGIHLIITSSRWMDIRPNVREKLLSKFELRLGDTSESEFDSRAARRVPQSRPGRGMHLEISSDGTKKTYDILVGVPRIDGVASADDLGAAVSAACQYISDLYPTLHAPAVRLLPEVIDRQEILSALHSAQYTLNPCEVLLGIDEDGLNPVIINFDHSPLFLGFAAQESGKTTLLRNITHSLVENGTPEQSKLVIFDYHRSMLGDINTEHIHAYVTSSMQADSIVEGVAQQLKDRMPPADITPQQLRDRSWWQGPDYYFVVDDYDLVSQGTYDPSPLEPLLPFIPIAKDVGLKLIIMRRSGGAYRASNEAILKTMRELNTDGIMMNGDPEEDALLGSNVKMKPYPPGRGTLVSRRLGNKLVQIAYMRPLLED